MAGWNPWVPVGVGLAAVCGAWIRFGLTRFGAARLHQPCWATWGVNMLACFLMGLLASPGRARPGLVQGWGLELALAVGFLGSLSTFSTLMVELATTWKKRARRQTVALGMASLLGGLLACRLGLTLGSSPP